MIFGTVEEFDANKGYGFILGEDGRQYFVHGNFIMTKGVICLNRDDKVQFNTFESKKGFQAVNVVTDHSEKETVILLDNPFTPQHPVVDPLKFAARRDPITSAIHSIYNNNNIFVTGTRGIGKTSLANQLVLMVKGDERLLNKLKNCGDWRLF